jgi:hypothetical protein
MIVRPPVGTSSNAVYNSAYPTQDKNNFAGAFQCGLNNPFVPYFWYRGFTSGQKSGQRDRFSFHSPQFGRGSTDCGPLNGFNAPHLFSGPNSFAVLNNYFGSSVAGVRNGSFSSTMAVHSPHKNSQAQRLCSQVGYIDYPHGAFLSPRTCQICYTSGHVALRCSQRSAPRQVVASGSTFQCQICLKTGHSVADTTMIFISQLQQNLKLLLLPSPLNQCQPSFMLYQVAVIPCLMTMVLSYCRSFLQVETSILAPIITMAIY